jgi:hypothetical protein
MAEAKRKKQDVDRNLNDNVGLEGFDTFFEGEQKTADTGSATNTGEKIIATQIDRLVNKFDELITFSVDQRIETAKIANQLIENQRQLVATQQILIRLMERSIELTRHIAAIEEKLPAIFELPTMVDNLRMRLAQLEGIEID